MFYTNSIGWGAGFVMFTLKIITRVNCL